MSFTAYMEKIVNHEILSEEEQNRLAKLAQEGDSQSRTRLVECNLRLVVKLANNYKNHGVALEDLVSAGNVGLVASVDKYDCTRGTKFTTCARWWIINEICQTISALSKPVSFSRGTAYRIKKVHDIVNKLKQEDADGVISEVDVEDVKNTMNRKSLGSLQSLMQGYSGISLNQTMYENSESEYIDHFIVEDDSAIDKIIHNEMLGIMKKCLSKLNNAERFIIEHRYGINNNEVMTQDEIARHIGKTHQRVQQMESEILKKLKMLIADRA